MKDQPIPLQATRAARKSAGGLKAAGAVAASVLAIGAGTGALAGHIGQPGSNSNGSAAAASAEAEQSLPASDLFGTTKPSSEATTEPAETAEPTEQPVMTAPKPAPTATHETETEHEGTAGSSSGGDD